MDFLPGLANAALQMTGLGPGTSGVAGDLVKGRVIEALAHGVTDGVEEGGPDELSTKGESDHRICGASQERVSGEGAE